MTLFLLVFLAVYSLFHALFYSRVRILLPDKGPYHLLLVIFLGLMIVAPICARLLEKNGHELPARIAAHIGYIWMGYIYYAFWLFLLVGLAGAICRLLNFALGSSLPLFQGGKTALVVMGLSVLINIYGFCEARWIRVERIVIRTAKLPAGIDHLRIAQISDIHLGLLVWNGALSSILDKVKAATPDILVSTGDLVDGNIAEPEKLSAVFGTIECRYGKYAVTGNHEAYAGLEQCIDAERRLGFVMLRGEMKNVENIINIAGVDDPAAGSPDDEPAMLARGGNGLFTLLLKHRPDVRSESLGLFDLQLSGHTHFGQLYPFRYFSERVYPLQNGPYYLDKGSVEYTSRGSGTWGPPIRVLASPEVTIIDLVRKEG